MDNNKLYIASIALPFLLPTSTLAQMESGSQSAAERGFLLEEVIVTAQKRKTSLQDTPLAISAFSGRLLESRGIDTLSSLQADVPSLHVGQEQDGFKISIRGIGLQGTSSISDPGVALYLDGFYIPRPTGGSAVFFDTERVEVLRGPQGTLYGRNATGGVVNVISKEPVFEREGQVGISVGERDLREVRGAYNAPLGEKFAGRITAVYSEEEGYIENVGTAPGSEDLLGREGDVHGRAQLRYTGHEGLDVLFSLTHSDLKGSGVPLKFLERNIGGPPPTRALLATLPPDSSDPLTIATDSPSLNDTRTTIVFGRVTQEFDQMELFVQAGTLRQDADLVQDTDGSEVPVSVFTKDLENEAESVEARLSSTGDQGLDWLVGAYYFNEDTDLQRHVTLNGLGPGGLFALPDFLLDEEGGASTVAGFGSLTYALSDTLDTTVGARWTRDERTGTKITHSNFGQPLPPDLVDVEVSYSRVTWKAGLEWRPYEETLIFASISNGYKAGGFNLSSSGQPYDPEEVTAYEFGVKSSPFGRRAQLNLDAFYYDYTDLQLTNLTSVNNAPGQLTTNAAESTIYGLEVSGIYNATPAFQISLHYAYTDATFDEYFNTDPRNQNPEFNPDDPLGLGRANLEGNRLPYVSEHAATLGLTYITELEGAGELTFAINSSWHSDRFMREYNDPTIDRQGSNTKTDASVTYTVGASGLRMTAYVTNIENDTELNNVQISPGFIGTSAVGAYTRPRSFGLRMDYSF